MAIPKSPVFVRQATGLVRSMSWVDLMFLNVISFGGAWSIIYALTYAPYYGGDPAVSLLLTAPGILALLGVYYIFNTSMPRSGGDYVYTSRVLHPSIGFAANFVGYTVFLWFWIADAASVFSSQGLAQTLSVYGALTGSASAANIAGQLGLPWNNFALGAAVLLIFAGIVIVSKRLYFWIQNVMMTLAVVGLVIMAILLLVAYASPSGFQTSFNHYALAVNANNSALTPDPYDNISQTASFGVTTPPGAGLNNIVGNLSLVPLWFTVLFWVFVSNYLGGETKTVNSSARKALFGSFAIIFISTIVILEVAYYALGFGFITGIDNIYYAFVPNTLGAPPNLTLLMGILANNGPLVLFLGIGIIAGFILVAPQSMILMSRILFSYSFDRVAPGWLADVNMRFATPVKATLVALGGALIMLVFLSGILGTGSSTTAFALYSYAGLGTVTLTFGATSIAAILFPYRRKQLYDTSSTVKRKIAGVPVITWLGLITLVYVLATIIPYTVNKDFYLFPCSSFATTLVSCAYYDFLAILFALFFVAIGFYFIVRSIRSKSGIPFDTAFAEIPPE